MVEVSDEMAAGGREAVPPSLNNNNNVLRTNGGKHNGAEKNGGKQNGNRDIDANHNVNGENGGKSSSVRTDAFLGDLSNLRTINRLGVNQTYLLISGIMFIFLWFQFLKIAQGYSFEIKASLALT